MIFNLARLAFVGVYVVVILVLLVAYYIVAALAYKKALTAVGYDKPWMAWIPLANYYALADAASDRQENINLFNNVTVPAALYKFWWAVMIAATFVPVIGRLLSTAIRIIFLGNCFVKLYAKIEYTSEEQQLTIGYLSGFLSIIAVIKFLTMKNDTKTIY